MARKDDVIGAKMAAVDYGGPAVMPVTRCDARCCFYMKSGDIVASDGVRVVSYCVERLRQIEVRGGIMVAVARQASVRRRCYESEISSSQAVSRQAEPCLRQAAKRGECRQAGEDRGVQAAAPPEAGRQECAGRCRGRGAKVVVAGAQCRRGRRMVLQRVSIVRQRAAGRRRPLTIWRRARYAEP